MNNILSYTYEGKEMKVRILIEEINIQNSLDLKKKLSSLKLSQVKTVTINMNHVKRIDNSGIDVFNGYKKLLGSFSIAVSFEDVRDHIKL